MSESTVVLLDDTEKWCFSTELLKEVIDNKLIELGCYDKKRLTSGDFIIDMLVEDLIKDIFKSLVVNTGKDENGDWVKIVLNSKNGVNSLKIPV